MEPSIEEINTMSKGLITGQQVQALEDRKIEIGKEISKLEEHIKYLDGIVENHDALKGKYSALLTSIDSMIELKNSIQTEIDKLSIVLDTKKVLIAEVDKYKGMIKVLQQEMKEFEANYRTMKLNAEQDLIVLKEQLDSLYKGIGGVIERLK